MDFQITMTGFVALYIFMLAGFSGWVIIGHVPAILHTPLMSGSNFVHHGAGADYWLLCRTPGCRKCRRWLCSYGSYVGDVPA
jgi:hypothetical protein